MPTYSIINMMMTDEQYAYDVPAIGIHLNYTYVLRFILNYQYYERTKLTIFNGNLEDFLLN